MMAEVVFLGAVACGAGALRATRLVASACCLAATSVLLATGLYLLDAPYAGAIEVSVGTGLVAVLLVFAIAVTGEQGTRARPQIPRWAASTLVGATLLGLAVLSSPLPSAPATVVDASFRQVFWTTRGLDALLQIVLLYVVALATAGLAGRRGRDDAATSSVESRRQRIVRAAPDTPARRAPAATHEPPGELVAGEEVPV